MNYLSYIVFGLTIFASGVWLIDQLFIQSYRKFETNTRKTLTQRIYDALPILLFISLLILIRNVRQGLNFDFNMILVPITLIFLVVIVADKFYFKDRENLGKGKERSLISNSYDFFPLICIALVLRSFVMEPFNIPSSSMAPTLYTGDFILVNKYAYGIRLPLLNTKVINSGQPEHGDVAVFRYPNEPNKYYIKRVIGLPGDEVSFDEGQLSINGQKLITNADDFVADKEMIKQLYPIGLKHKDHVFTIDELARLGLQEESMANYFEEQQGEHQHLVRYLEGNSQFSYGDFIRKHNPNIQASEKVSWNITVPEGQYFVMGDNRDRSQDSRFWGFVPDENLSGKAVYVWMHKKPGFSVPTFMNNGKIN